MTDGIITIRPRRESDRLVTERSRHIYAWSDPRNLARPLAEAPFGFCGRRIETGAFVAGLHIRSYLQMARHRSFEKFRDKVTLTRNLCPACERLVPNFLAENAAAA